VVGANVTELSFTSPLAVGRRVVAMDKPAAPPRRAKNLDGNLPRAHSGSFFPTNDNSHNPGTHRGKSSRRRKAALEMDRARALHPRVRLLTIQAGKSRGRCADSLKALLTADWQESAGIKVKLLSMSYGLATISRAASQLVLTGDMDQDKRGRLTIWRTG